MASLHSCCLTVLFGLFACLGFCHTGVIKDGMKPPIKIFHQSCALKKDEGPCKAILDRFYFNTETGHCEPFEYGGCQGNENNFSSLKDCEDMCLVNEHKSPCLLEEEPGPCRGLVPRYFFDSTKKVCRRFFFGGCFGNANNFMTVKECQDRCQPGNHSKEPQDSLKTEEKELVVRKIDIGSVSASHAQPQKLPRLESNTDTKFVPPDRCLSPPQQGECKDMQRRFFYEPKTQKCLPFLYHGCGGNENNFSIKRHCIRTCMKGLKKHPSQGQIRIKTKTANNLLGPI